VVVVAVQSIFRLEMHQNDIFFNKKKFRSTYQNDMKYKKNYFLVKTKFKILRKHRVSKQQSSCRV